MAGSWKHCQLLTLMLHCWLVYDFGEDVTTMLASDPTRRFRCTPVADNGTQRSKNRQLSPLARLAQPKLASHDMMQKHDTLQRCDYCITKRLEDQASLGPQLPYHPGGSGRGHTEDIGRRRLLHVT